MRKWDSLKAVEMVHRWDYWLLMAAERAGMLESEIVMEK
jgi:hypothetical protein